MYASGEGDSDADVLNRSVLGSILFFLLTLEVIIVLERS